MRHVIDLVGRIFISIIFFFEAYDAIKYFKDTKVLLGEYGIEWAENSFMILGIAFLVIGSTLILLGYRVGLGCILLLLYLIPVTFLAYSFWNDSEEIRRLHSIIFMKNIAIIGGLLILSLPSQAKFRLKRIFQAAKFSKPDWTDTE